MAEQSKYTVERALASLQKAGCKVVSGKVIEFKKGTLGIKLLGMLDFVCGASDYTFKILNPK